MSYNTAHLLIKHVLSQQKHLAEQQKKIKEHFMKTFSDDSDAVQMKETRIYVGLNDTETKQQKFGTEYYKTILKKVCYHYHVPFSVGIEEGGYFHEDGEYTEEETLVLTLIDAEKDTVRKIAEELCTLFHQESVLITEDNVTGCFILEK